MKYFLMLLVVVLFLPCVLTAGETEITIHSGWSFLNANQTFPGCPICLSPIQFPEAEARIKQSMLFGFKVGHTLNNHIGVEGGFAVAPNHTFKVNNPPIVCIPENPCPLKDGGEALFFPFPQQSDNVVAYQYEGNFVYNFAMGQTEPFFTFGVGGVSSDFQNNFRNNFAFNFGGGAKFYFGNLGLRLEVNDHVLPSYFLNSNTEHDVQIQYGLVFRLL